MKLLEELNPQQKEAVLCTEGPVLVLSGAGSGKTRVLTHKVAYLLETGFAKPYEILAVTFTNKAAGEMRERIEHLTGGRTEHMWVGTFHSLFARVMRRYGERLGYRSDFAIYDREDQERLMKEVLAEFPDQYDSRACKRVVNRISSFKGRLQIPAPAEHGWMPLDRDLPMIYEAYEVRMKRNNALDFDDLLIKPLDLMLKFPDVGAVYQERFRYILVDEFQDTNTAQNELLKTLWAKHRNLTVVGDDDQSIYGWRGAQIENILNFPNDYPGAKVFRLERNYRSTAQILKAAQSVIDNNLGRHQKTLWTERSEGAKPELMSLWDAREEAVAIAQAALDLKAEGFDFSQIAVLYRVNAHSRSLESALRERNIPYTIVGGLKFYQRKEIKDILAYLKLVSNPSDSVSLLRVINFPPRGIGATTINRLAEHARREGIAAWEALQKVEEIETIKPGTAKKLKDFVQLTVSLQGQRDELSFPSLVKLTLERTGIADYYLKEGDEEAFVRLDNLKEFVIAVEEYCRAYPERTLEDFLGEAALVSDTDEWEKGDMVSLMTVHSAKGLEFPVVFIAGLQDGLFPLIRDGRGDFEEERRLFYVGATRAMDKLYLTCASTGRDGMQCECSRFIEEIPPEMLVSIRAGGRGRPYKGGRTSREPSLFVRASNSHPSYSTSSFKRGDQVFHQKFGEGIVSACEGSGDSEKVMVYFQGYGAKKLLVKFAELKKITM